jgi:hypothetical protein
VLAGATVDPSSVRPCRRTPRGEEACERGDVDDCRCAAVREPRDPTGHNRASHGLVLEGSPIEVTQPETIRPMAETLIVFPHVSRDSIRAVFVGHPEETAKRPGVGPLESA